MYLNLKPYNTIKDEDLKSSRAGFFLLFVCFKASSPSPPSPPPSLSQVSSLWLSLSAFLSQRLFSRWLPSPLTSCWNIKSSNTSSFRPSLLFFSGLWSFEFSPLSSVIPDAHTNTSHLIITSFVAEHFYFVVVTVTPCLTVIPRLVMNSPFGGRITDVLIWPHLRCNSPEVPEQPCGKSIKRETLRLCQDTNFQFLRKPHPTHQHHARSDHFLHFLDVFCSCLRTCTLLLVH